MNKIIVPEHYKILVDNLKPLIKDIQNAFINRPVPEGRYVENVSLLATLWLEPLERTIKKLTTELNELSNLIMPGKEPLAYEIRYSVQSLSQVIKSVIDIFHDIWKRRFHPNISDSQTLLSAVPEMILKECISLFERIVDIVENPNEVKTKYGSFNVNLTITFGDEEIKRFGQWLNQNRLKISGISEKRYTFSNLALAFLLGWWIGDD
jgi:hypothetical protein